MTAACRITAHRFRPLLEEFGLCRFDRPIRHHLLDAGETLVDAGGRRIAMSEGSLVFRFREEVVPMKIGKASGTKDKDDKRQDARRRPVQKGTSIRTGHRLKRDRSCQ